MGYIKVKIDKEDLINGIRNRIYDVKHYFHGSTTIQKIVEKSLREYLFVRSQKTMWMKLGRTYRRQLCKEQKGRCYYCLKRCSFKEGTLDHKVAKLVDPAKTVRKSNLVFCCAECNQRKGLIPHDEFIFLLHNGFYDKK